MQTCSQKLFTIIDDTIGGGWHKSATSNVTRIKIAVRKAKPAHEIGWDLSQVSNLNNCWVLAPTVFSKEPVLHRLAMHELLALWDFPQPKTSILASELSVLFLHMLLCRLPGKFLRKVVYEPLTFLRKQSFPNDQGDIIVPQTPTFSYKSAGEMEEETNILHLKAVKADTARVDYSMWALPNETLRQAWAWEVLQKYLHRWWNAHLRREAYTWLNTIQTAVCWNIRLKSQSHLGLLEACKSVDVLRMERWLSLVLLEVATLVEVCQRQQTILPYFTTPKLDGEKHPAQNMGTRIETEREEG